MGWHSEKSLYSLTRGEIARERERVDKGYHSDYFDEIVKERKGSSGSTDDSEPRGD